MMLQRKGVRVTIIPHENGYLNPQTIQQAISSKTKLIAVTHMPNILGTAQPVEAIGRIAHMTVWNVTFHARTATAR
jgi:cysteine desulfurase/selenocysteine lyase